LKSFFNIRIFLFFKAANSDARNNLGNMYYYGRGIDKDFEKAFERQQTQDIIMLNIILLKCMNMEKGYKSSNLLV
jgi:hypothetical protein